MTTKTKRATPTTAPITGPATQPADVDVAAGDCDPDALEGVAWVVVAAAFVDPPELGDAFALPLAPAEFGGFVGVAIAVQVVSLLLSMIRRGI
jgi:hypothetical protein